MAVNHYFQGGDGIGSDNEKRLIQDLIVENLKIYGHAVYYLPRTLVNRDLILGEDSASRFDDSYLIEMYFDCLLYTSPSPRDLSTSRMPSSA